MTDTLAYANRIGAFRLAFQLNMECAKHALQAGDTVDAIASVRAALANANRDGSRAHRAAALRVLNWLRVAGPK